MSYKPQMVNSNTISNIVSWIFRELTRISNTFTKERANTNIPVIHEAPEKPQVGDIRFADGTDWDPSHGAGLYLYNQSGAWVRIKFNHE